MKHIFLFVVICLFTTGAKAVNYFSAEDSIAIRERLKEVVIVAEKKEAKPLDTPVAVSVLNASDIPAQGGIDIRNLSALVPNFYMPESGLKLSTPVFIRGIGTPTANPTVGLYVDGVPVFDKNTYIFDLYDIRQVEILRGPQGTLQGRNTLGGMINILTNPPTSDFGVSGKIGYSSYNTQNYHILLNVPFSEKFFNKFFFAYNRSNGFFKNKTNGQRMDENKGYTLRYQGRWMPGTDWDIKFGADYYKTRDGGNCYYFPDSLKKEHYKIAYNSPTSYKRDLVNSYLNIKKVFDFMRLNAVTSYSYYDDKQESDQDYSALDIYYNEKPSHQNLVTQEISLQSAPDTPFLDWIVGGFGFYKDLNNKLTTNYMSQKDTVKINMRPVLSTCIQDLYENHTTTKGIAGYGQVTVKNLLPGFFITAGIRYDVEHSKVNYRDTMVRARYSGNITRSDTTLSQSKTFREWLPKFTLMQKWNDRMTSYFTVSKGYRAGGYNIVFNLARNNLQYDNDYTWNYELGYKFVSRSGKFRFNTAVFYIDWHNQQLFQMEMNAAVIKNGGDAFSAGGEFDMQWKIIPGLTYTLAAGYTHAEYTDYSGKNVMGSGEYDYKGNRLPMVPEFTFNTGLSYYKELNAGFLKDIFVTTNVSGTGKQYFNDANVKELRQKAFFLWNASCELSLQKYIGLEVWAKNILNRHYFSNMLASPLSMVNENMKYLAQSGAPATVGVSLSFKW